MSYSAYRSSSPFTVRCRALRLPCSAGAILTENNPETMASHARATKAATNCATRRGIETSRARREKKKKNYACTRMHVCARPWHDVSSPLKLCFHFSLFSMPGSRGRARAQSVRSHFGHSYVRSRILQCSTEKKSQKRERKNKIKNKMVRECGQGAWRGAHNRHCSSPSLKQFPRETQSSRPDWERSEQRGSGSKPCVRTFSCFLGFFCGVPRSSC